MARKLQVFGSFLSSEIDPAKIKELVDAYLQENPPSSSPNVVSPTILIEKIDGGHRITITDINGAQSFDVLDGTSGVTPNDNIDYFTSLALAEEAAATAGPYGTNAPYYFGQKILVSENEEETWYMIKRPGVLVAESTGASESISLLIEGVNYNANNLSEPELSDDGENYILYLN